MRDPRERLKDILDAIERIERYAVLGEQAFAEDELIQVWIIHYLQLLGEAAGQLGRDFHQQYPVAPWQQIVAMRNILIHEYFGVDTREIWRTVERDVPRLKHAVADLLRRLPE